jgi:hypothetical protein
LLTLSISCPNCGKQFRNIKSEMAGKKARCSCGTIVRLGPKRSRTEAANSAPPTSASPPNDLLSVDLMGDEMLGDQLLGGELSDARKSPAAKTPARDRSQPIEVPVVVLPPLGLAHPRPAKVKRQQHKPKSHGSDQPNRSGQSPVFGETYGDLDEILRGQGDPAPLVVRPQPVPPDAAEQTRTDAEGPKPHGPSTFGFLAAIGSATLAFWFGVLVVVSRFQIVEVPLLNNFSVTLESVYLAAFGTADVSPTFQNIFVSLGWALSIVAGALMLFAVAQFINAFVRILFRHSFMDWSDGMTAAAAVCALFLMVAMVFAHASFTKQQHRLLDEYERPTVLDRGPIGNVDLLRAEIVDAETTFRTTMLVGAGIPMSIFMLSMARLFFKTPEIARGRRKTIVNP